MIKKVIDIVKGIHSSRTKTDFKDPELQSLAEWYYFEYNGPMRIPKGVDLCGWLRDLKTQFEFEACLGISYKSKARECVRILSKAQPDCDDQELYSLVMWYCFTYEGVTGIPPNVDLCTWLRDLKTNDYFIGSGD